MISTMMLPGVIALWRSVTCGSDCRRRRGLACHQGNAAGIVDALRRQNDGVVVRIQKTAVHHHVFDPTPMLIPSPLRQLSSVSVRFPRYTLSTAVYYDVITVGTQNFYIAHLYVPCC
ncbi:MAG: hypothetical protein ACLRTQ_07950 [Candidatus Borkfalkia sp.]